jgi:hypothetical protein
MPGNHFDFRGSAPEFLDPVFDDADDEMEALRADARAAKRRERAGRCFDERTGAWDYCPEDPQRQLPEPDDEEE